MRSVPTIGRIWSLLFAFDPPGLLQLARWKARDAGVPFCQFRLGGEWLTIVLEPELGKALLRWPLEGRTRPRFMISAVAAPLLRFFRPEVLAPLLGRQAPLLTDGGAHAVARAILGTLFDPGPPGEPDRIEAALAEAEQALAVELARRLLDQPTIDLAAVLREVAVGMVLRILGAQDGVGAAQRLLWAADTPELVEPRLRQLEKIGWGRWHHLASARAELVEHLQAAGLETAGEQDAAITMLVGMADNPVMMTLQRFLVVNDLLDPDDAHPLVPFILRQVQEPFEVAGVKFARGDALAIDATSLPFGAGEHHCPGRVLADDFCARMIQAVERMRLKPIPGKYKVRRMRLSYGISELWISATGGA